MNKAQTFQAGDVVTLKSGSPKMTVTQDHGEDSVDVVYWSEPQQTFFSRPFPKSTLRKVTK